MMDKLPISDEELTKWFNDQLMLPHECNTNIEIQNDMDNISGHLANCFNNPNWYKNESITDHQMESILNNYNVIWLSSLLKHFFKERPVSSTDLSHRTINGLIMRSINDRMTNRIANSNVNPKTMLFIELFQIIYWLDEAKMKCFLKSDPCLFVNVVHSSEQVLNTLCQMFFLPERLQRVRFKLKQLELSLKHHQKRIHQLDFRVKRLSCDLNDGIRLARLIQLFFPDRFGHLLEHLKYACQHNKHRIDNMNYLFEQCSPLLTAYDKQFQWSYENAIAIVHSHRQPTVQLLHCLIRTKMAISIQQHYSLKMKQIISIQQYVRYRMLSKKIRKQYLHLLWAIRLIQSTYRTKTIRKQYLQLRKSALFLQRTFRRRRNLRLIVNYLNRCLEKRQKAALYIQRCWRGYRTRIEIYVQMPYIRLISHKLHQSKLSGGLSIGTKANNIVQWLMSLTTPVNTDRMLINKQLMVNVQQLLCYCQYSARIAIELQPKCEIIVAILIDLLANMNRSETHKLCTLNIVSLLNLLLAKHHIQDEQLRWKLVDRLMNVLGKHQHYAPMVKSSLTLLNELTKNPMDRLRLKQHVKWKRLAENLSIWYRYGELDNQCHCIYFLVKSINKNEQMTH